MFNTHAIVSLCAIAATTSIASAQSVSLLDIPITGATTISVTDVNADGSIVSGLYFNAAGDRLGFIFNRTTNTVTDLGIVAGNLVLVSDDGMVAAAEQDDPISLGEAAARWTAATNQWTILPNLGVPCSGSTFSLYDMSSDGNHIVGLGWLACGAGSATALHWDTVNGLEVLLGVRCNAISDDGTRITGFDHHPTSGFRIWANWDNNVITTPLPQSTSEGYVMSSDGTWMAGTKGRDLVRYSDATGFEAFGPALPFDISDDGQSIFVLGGTFFTGTYLGMWTPATGLIKLTDFVGSALTGWDFGFRPLGVMSDDASTIIIRNGRDPNGTKGNILIELGSSCPCACDVDTSTGAGVCDIFDFLGFQNAFVGADPCACDKDTTTGAGVCDIFDFLAFQNEFVAGCP